MKTALTHFYDDHIGLFLSLIVITGILMGAGLAYDPAVQAETALADATATPVRPQATQANISIAVPTATVEPATLAEYGTLVAPFNVRIFKDPDGFVSAPLPDPSGGLFLTGAGGVLYNLDSSGGIRWNVELPGAAVGDLLLTPGERIIAADRSGRLAAYTTTGVLVWEFSPGESFSAVSGPALGPEGNLYYMLESGGDGVLQSVSPGGTSRWQTRVETSSYRVTPWVYPGGNLVFVKSAAYDLNTGSPVQLTLPFEIDAWITSLDGSAFLQRGQTIAAWSIADGSVSLPEDGPKFVIPDPGATIRQASIDLNGISWIAYIGQTTDGIAWYNPDGSLAHQMVTGNVLLSIIVASDEQGTLYGCGPSPREVSAEQLAQRTTYCLAFVPGEEKPHWQKPFATAAEFFVGSFRQGSEVYIATESGDLVVLGREQGTAQAEREPTGAAAIPGGWYWKAPAPVVNYPILLPDGTLPLLLEDGRVYFLGTDGRLAGNLQLPEFQGPETSFQLPVYFFEDRIVVTILTNRVYAMQAETGQLWEFPIVVAEAGEEPPDTPVLHQYSGGGVEFLLDASRTLYAYTPNDGLLWQYTLQEGLRDDFSSPAVTDTGWLHIADTNGTLYTFNAGGLVWSFHPDGNLRGASDPQVGPDGNLYYVVTSGSTGYLESLSPAGEQRWEARLETFRFYTAPRFAAGGTYIRVADDFVNANTGVPLSLEFPFEVDDFIEGADGKDYLRTGNHIIQWQIGAGGYEEIHSYLVNMERSNTFIEPIIIVYPPGDIEIQVFDPEGTRFIWLDPDTGEINSEIHTWSEITFGTDQIGPEKVHCDQDLNAKEITCIKELPGSPELPWSLTIQGIDGSLLGFPPPILYRDGQLYLITGGQNLYMFEVEIP